MQWGSTLRFMSLSGAPSSLQGTASLVADQRTPRLYAVGNLPTIDIIDPAKPVSLTPLTLLI
jgi:hypothetical protein